MTSRVHVIIGGAGFLGQSLITRLATDPEWLDTEIRCLDRVAYPAEAARPARFREYVGDAHDLDLLRTALDGADTVWIRAANLGGAASIDPSRINDYLEANVDLVARVLEVADDLGCRQVLFDSSEQVFGDAADHQAQTVDAEPVAGNYYGAAKLIAERLLRQWSEKENGRSAQILRYSRVRARTTRDIIRVMITRALAGEPLRIIGNSTRKVAFVHVDDVIDANVAALRRTPTFALYHVGADRPLSLHELAIRIREVANSAVGTWSHIELGPGTAPFEPQVVGMQWETSRRELGLATPRNLDEMLHQTLADVRAS